MILEVLLLSLLAASGTGIGGFLATVLFKPRERIIDTLLGFTSGVMLSLIFFQLLAHSMDAIGLTTASVGFILGVLIMLAIDYFLPHIHAKISSRLGVGDNTRIRVGLLIAIGIAVHNIPEGLAIGVSYASLPALGIFIAVAITIHNVPEGLATAAPLCAGGMCRSKACLMAFLSGLAEPAAALLSILLLGSVSTMILGLSLAFAAGAMFYITGDELIPESHAHGYEHEATIAMVVGLLLTMAISSIIGA